MPSAMLNLLHRFVRSRPNQMARHLPVPLEHSCIAPGPRFFAQICPPAMLNRFFSDEAEISRAIRCGPKLCTRKRWAIGSIATGSVLFALGMFALLYIPIALRDGVNSNMIVSSADSPLYDKFAHGGADPAPVIDNFYLYNCTNFDAVLQGHAPVMELLGPYAFRRYTDRMQAQWSDTDHGQVVRYIEWKHWDAAPPGTPTRDPTETIVNLNQGYLGALATAGGELKLSFAMIAAVILDVFHGLSDAALPATRLAYAIPMIGSQVKSILSDPHINGNVTLFQALWAASISPPWNYTSDWDLLLPAQVVGRPLTLSQHSLTLLWDSTLIGSIANTSPDSVLALQRAASGQDALNKWADAFGIDPSTAAAILLQWLPRYMCGKSDPLLCAAAGTSADCGCSQNPNPVCGDVSAEWKLPCNEGIGALAWQQFAKGTVSTTVWNQPSMVTVFPSLFPGSELDTPELAGFLHDMLPSFSIPTEAAVVWLTGPCGIANASNLLEWIEASVLDPELLAQCYNMNLSTAASLNGYLLYLRPFASVPYAQNIFAKNGGVKLEQSAYKWLFDTIDPLVQRLSPSQSRVNFMKNFSWEETRNAAMFDTMFTGKDDIKRIMQYKSWHNESSLDYVGGSMAIEGTYTGIGFQPWEVPDLLPVYEEDLFRVVHLQALPDATKAITVQGIKMNLYTVSSDDFSVHLKIGNYRNGFINGSAFEHAPIFWSKLFFYDSPGNWSSRIVLINPPESLQGDTCETRIGVEPLTGQIMYARKRMQTNLYVSAAKEDPSSFTKYNNKIYRGPSPTDGFMMPMFYLDESAQIGTADADMFKSQVYGTQTVGLIMGITNVCVGSVTMIIGIIMYWFDRKSNQHRILLEDSDQDEESPAAEAITSSFFAASSDRTAPGLQAPPGSPRATDL